MSTDTPDGLTVIEAQGRRLCKLLRADGSAEAYDSARTLDLHPVEAPDLEALATLLRDLAGRWSCAVVRGAVADENAVVTSQVKALSFPTGRDLIAFVEAMKVEVGDPRGSITQPQTKRA